MIQKETSTCPRNSFGNGYKLFCPYFIYSKRFSPHGICHKSLYFSNCICSVLCKHTHTRTNTQIILNLNQVWNLTVRLPDKEHLLIISLKKRVKKIYKIEDFGFTSPLIPLYNRKLINKYGKKQIHPLRV